MMIKKLTLKNFRCFDDFTLEGIRPITLIAGTNNVGKSTLLESIYLFMDRNSSDVFLKLNGFRGIREIPLSPQMLWEPLFRDMDSDKSISICINSDEEKQTAVFNRDNSFTISSIPEAILSHKTQSSIQLVNSYPLRLEYTDKTRSDISHFVITEAGITLSGRKPVTTPHGFFYSSSTTITPSKVAELFGKVDLVGSKPRCIEILRLLDNRIKDLSVIVTGGIAVIFADLGLISKLPVAMLGDGMNKLMSIALLMLANPGAVILLDEIENGFHYSFFQKLWDIIGKLVTDTGCQLFATTHSYECINGAIALSINKDAPNLFRFVRLDNSDETIIPHVFENDSFEYAVENEWEIR